MDPRLFICIPSRSRRERRLGERYFILYRCVHFFKDQSDNNKVGIKLKTMTALMPDKKILQLRQAIDAVDDDILQLINQRLSIAREIGRIKAEKGVQVVDPVRESSLIERLNALNKGPLGKENLYHIFREIITVSREIQEPQLTEFLGPGSTAVYAVIGDPVSHSLSPVMHNRAFAHIGHNGVYVPFRVKDIQAAVDETGKYSSCVGVKNCGHPNEEIILDIGELSERSPDYWTLILAKQNTNNGSTKK